MIREATHDDIPALIEMGRQLVEESPRLDVTFSAAILRTRLFNAIEHPGQVVLMAGAEVRGIANPPVYENAGALIGAAAPGLAWEEIEAAEIGFFTRAKARRSGVATELMRAFVEWAVRHGASVVRFGSRTGINAVAAEKIADALGFSADLGEGYVKTLDAGPQSSR